SGQCGAVDVSDAGGGRRHPVPGPVVVVFAVRFVVRAGGGVDCGDGGGAAGRVGGDADVRPRRVLAGFHGRRVRRVRQHGRGCCAGLRGGAGPDGRAGGRGVGGVVRGAAGAVVGDCRRWRGGRCGGGGQ